MTMNLKLKGKQRIGVIKIMYCPKIPSSIYREAKELVEQTEKFFWGKQ